ncbi:MULTISPECIES: DUF4136 domain-containing protein [Burkholderiaceae]|uniref:DUF4136 domain-containing protein n=2 Tax=Burkholderiales TaxID=80840 RepID=UPI00096291FC|nr:DUF4136 domain-containing protein [Burkholderia sp. b14]SIT80673.1 protein of unknown function [Burkholderia sp. b14]
MMFRRLLQHVTRGRQWAAGSLAMLVLSGCASYVTSDVIAFNAWSTSASDRDRTFAFKRDAQQQNSIEQCTYEAQLADELSHYHFRQVAPTSAHYDVELAYGTHAGSIVVQQPVYTDPWWPGWGRPGPWWPFGMMPAYVDTALPVFVQSLTIRMTERSSGKERYKVTATTPTARQSLPLAMPYLIRSALADFPLQNGTTRQVRLPAELHGQAAGGAPPSFNEKAAPAASPMRDDVPTASPRRDEQPAPDASPSAGR